MKYLHHINLPSLNLSPLEEAYLDFNASLDHQLNRLPRQSYGLWNAIEDFKDSLYELCIDHLAAGEDKAHWNGLLEKLRHDSKLNISRAKAYPLEEVFKRYGLEPRYGQYLCPFHPDSHPSMSIDRRTNRFKCWSCNASGDSIDFVQRMGNLTFPQACQMLN